MSKVKFSFLLIISIMLIVPSSYENNVFSIIKIGLSGLLGLIMVIKPMVLIGLFIKEDKPIDYKIIGFFRVLGFFNLFSSFFIFLGSD